MKLSKPLASRFGATTGAVERHASPVSDVCVARQPIFNRAGDVAGYELLYRRAPADGDARRSGRSAMAADVMAHTFIHRRLDQLTFGRSAFVNFTREMFLGRAYAPLSSSTVIELSDELRGDEEVENACEDLVGAGYTLALDGFVWRPESRRLLELATIVKIDVRNRSPANLDEIAERLAPYDVTLLAERVATMDVRRMCAGLGYELFQGCYYARPESTGKRALESDELAIVQALNMTRDAPHAGARLSLALLLVSSMAARSGTNRELLHLAVQRGRMCELIASTTGRDYEPSSFFLLGLLSLVDSISGVPKHEVLEALAPAPALCEALVARTGPYAGALGLTEAYEQGEWAAVSRDAASMGMDVSQLTALYVQSVVWSRERLRPVGVA